MMGLLTVANKPTNAMMTVTTPHSFTCATSSGLSNQQVIPVRAAQISDPYAVCFLELCNSFHGAVAYDAVRVPAGKAHAVQSLLYPFTQGAAFAAIDGMLRGGLVGVVPGLAVHVQVMPFIVQDSLQLRHLSVVMVIPYQGRVGAVLLAAAGTAPSIDFPFSTDIPVVAPSQSCLLYTSLGSLPASLHLGIRILPLADILNNHRFIG